MAPGPRRGSQNCLLLAEALSVAKVRAGSGQVAAGRGGQGRALRGHGLGTSGRPAPMETARDYAGALIRRVQPATPCVRGTPLAPLHFLCTPGPPASQVTLSPCVLLNPSSSSLAHPIRSLPPLPRLGSPCKSKPPGLVPTLASQRPPTHPPAAPRFLPQRVSGARWGAPEVRGSPRDKGQGWTRGGGRISCSSYGLWLQTLACVYAGGTGLLRVLGLRTELGVEGRESWFRYFG